MFFGFGRFFDWTALDFKLKAILPWGLLHEILFQSFWNLTLNTLFIVLNLWLFCNYYWIGKSWLICLSITLLMCSLLRLLFDTYFEIYSSFDSFKLLLFIFLSFVNIFFICYQHYILIFFLNIRSIYLPCFLKMTTLYRWWQTISFTYTGLSENSFSFLHTSHCQSSHFLAVNFHLIELLKVADILLL